ncbi:MAG: hypothetical protein Q8P20_01845 [bacterium]|nr:hypothetical protein [bacterium]
MRNNYHNILIIIAIIVVLLLGFDFINENGNAIQAIATVILALITYQYARFTKSIMSASEKNLEQYQKKEIMETTLSIFEIWMDIEMRKAFMYVANQDMIKLSIEYANMNKGEKEKIDLKYNSILSFMEYVGLLYRNNKIDKKLIQEHFKMVFPKLYYKLKFSISYEQSKNSDSWTNIDYLIQQIEKL